MKSKSQIKRETVMAGGTLDDAEKIIAKQFSEPRPSVPPRIMTATNCPVHGVFEYHTSGNCTCPPPLPEEPPPEQQREDDGEPTLSRYVAEGLARKALIAWLDYLDECDPETPGWNQARSEVLALFASLSSQLERQREEIERLKSLGVDQEESKARTEAPASKTQ